MDRESALLSMLKAMWGRVTPNLRGFYIGQKDGTKCLYFYYENIPSEDEEELASLMHTEFIADFPLQNIDFEIHTLPSAQKIPKNGWCVYLRYGELGPV